MESRHPILLASFDPLAVRGWLNVPLHLLTDCSIPLAEISPNLAPVVAENMLAGLSNALTLPGESALELNLSKRLALAAAELRRGATVRVAASAVEWSERQLERVFLSEMGLTPKMFARIVRLRRAIAFANAGTTLSTAAYSAGYADQSHFNRDMRALMSGSPSSLLQNVGNAKDIVDGKMAD
jgi:transcriptional regulator GlxA family with amidase domain